MAEQKLDPEVAAFVRERKLRWLNWGAPLILVALIFGGIILYVALTSKPELRMGDPCERAIQCGIKSTCLVTEEGSFCAPYCEKPTDCPPGYGCKVTEQINESGQKGGGWMFVCIKN